MPKTCVLNRFSTLPMIDTDVELRTITAEEPPVMLELAMVAFCTLSSVSALPPPEPARLQLFIVKLLTDTTDTAVPLTTTFRPLQSRSTLLAVTCMQIPLLPCDTTSAGSE